VGKENNPMVFPRTANVSTTLLHRNNDGKLYITHQAAGAEQFRYSTNFGSSYSEWLDYGSGEDLTLNATEWTGTEKQRWVGEHVTVQYWSSFSGSSSHIQEGDLELPDNYPALRRWPHVFMMGPFNLYGYDAGIDNGMKINQNGEWTYDFLADWPANVQANLWGVNPDGKPDQSYVYGDVDGDSILDRLPPSSLAMNSVNITVGPTTPYLSWQIVINDGSRRFILRPRGSRQLQIIMFVLLWVIPPLTAIFAVLVFKRSFYQVCIS
jgi:alpha-1,3-glucan synthase